MRKETINKILKEIEIGYDLISEKFSQTRSRFWRELEFIKKYAPKNGKVFDFGCGNGRILEILKGKNIDYVGMDVSEKLIELAKSKYSDSEGFSGIKFLKSDYSSEKIPFSEEYFDTIYSIAVFHHLPGQMERLDRAEDLFRLTKPGGYIVITVWNLWRIKYFGKIWKNWINKILGKSELDWNDLLINFTDNKGKVFNRYHHAFTIRELRRLFKKVGFEVDEVKKIGGNIILVGHK